MKPDTTPPLHNCGNCNACIFVEASAEVKANNIKAAGQHECRALPPQMIALPAHARDARGNVGMQFVPAAAWPVVDPEQGWCRMHAKREESASVAAHNA